MFNNNVADCERPNMVECPSDCKRPQIVMNDKEKKEPQETGIMYWKHISDISLPAPNHSTTGRVIERIIGGIINARKNEIRIKSTKTWAHSW